LGFGEIADKCGKWFKIIHGVVVPCDGIKLALRLYPELFQIRRLNGIRSPVHPKIKAEFY
jgi:hypothetical protein